jgi:hypothetical protein
VSGRTCRATRACSLLLAAAALSGCAHWERVELPSLRPAKLAVRPARAGVTMSTQALADFQGDLETALRAQTTGFIVTPSTADVDVVLDVRVAGYGKVERKWIAWLLGSGLAEGAAQGAALGVVAGPWAGLGIALEEVAQETLTWVGGAYVFDTFFTPVILEASLRSPSGEAAWTKTVMVERDRKAIKSLPADQRRSREARLRVTARAAAEKLARKLAKAVAAQQRN